VTGGLIALPAVVLVGCCPNCKPLAAAGLTAAGQELMNLWEEMDRGSLKQEEAFEEADKAVRRRNAAKEL
jgi:hypothetical protein